MRVDELIEVLKTLPPEMLVWKSKDDEGNGYHEVDDVVRGSFIRTEELEQWEVEEVLQQNEFEDYEVDPSEMTEVVIIW